MEDIREGNLIIEYGNNESDLTLCENSDFQFKIVLSLTGESDSGKTDIGTGNSLTLLEDMDKESKASRSRLEQLLTVGRAVQDGYENADGKNTPEYIPELIHRGNGDTTPVVPEAAGDNEKYHRNPRKRLLNNTNPSDSEQREKDPSGKAKKMPKTGHPKVQGSEGASCNNKAKDSPVGIDRNSQETNDTLTVGTKTVKPKDDYEYMGAQIDALLKMPSPPGNRWKDNERKFKCKTCSKSFLNNDDLKSHSLEHSEEKKVRPSPKERKVREKKGSKGDPAEGETKKSTSSQESPVRSWQCPSCSQTFGSKSSLMRHKRNEHPKINANPLDNLPKVDLGATLIDVNNLNDLKNDEANDYSDPPQLSLEVSSSSPVAVQTAFSIISTGILGKSKAEGNEDSRRQRGSGLQNAQNASPVMPSPSSTRSSRSVKQKANNSKTKATSDSKSGGKKKSNSQLSKSVSSEDEGEVAKAPPTPPSVSGRTSSRRNIQKPKWLTDSDLVTDYELPGTNAMRSSVANSTPSNLTNGNKSNASSSPDLKKAPSPTAAANKSEKNKRRASSTRDMDQSQEQKQIRLAEMEEEKKPTAEPQEVFAVKSKPKKPKKLKKEKQEKDKEKNSEKKVRKSKSSGTGKKSPTKRKSSSKPVVASVVEAKVAADQLASLLVSNEASIQEPNVPAETTDAMKLLEILEDREPETQTLPEPTATEAQEPAVPVTLKPEEVFNEVASNPPSAGELEPITTCQSSLSGQGSSSRMSFGSTSAMSSGLFSNVESPSFADIQSGKFKIHSPATVRLPRSSIDSNDSSNMSTGPFSVVESVSFADISAGKVAVSEVKRPRTASIASEEGRHEMEIDQPPLATTSRQPSVEKPLMIQTNEEIEEMPILKPEPASAAIVIAEVSDPVRDTPKSIDENHCNDPTNNTTSLIVPATEKAPLLCQEPELAVDTSPAPSDVLGKIVSHDVVSENVESGVFRGSDSGNVVSSASHDNVSQKDQPQVPVPFDDSIPIPMDHEFDELDSDDEEYEEELDEEEGEEEEDDDEMIVRPRRNRSDSLSMRSCGSGSPSEKIKALDEAATVQIKEKSASSLVIMHSDGYVDSESDTNDSLMSEFSELAAQVSENTDGVMLKEQCMRFLGTKISSKNMWSIRKELKRLKKNKNYFKFGKLAPLSGGLMHDIFCQSVLEDDLD